MSGIDRLPTITACYYTDIAGSGYPFTPGTELLLIHIHFELDVPGPA
jgi:hypothetical protein